MAACWRLRSRRGRAKRDAEERGIGFRYPVEFSTFCELAVAATRDSRPSSGRRRFEPDEWFDYAGREFSRHVRESVWRQTGLPRFRGTYCRPSTHREHEVRASGDADAERKIRATEVPVDGRSAFATAAALRAHEIRSRGRMEARPHRHRR